MKNDFAGPKKPSMKGHDYTRRGIYMLTLSTFRMLDWK